MPGKKLYERGPERVPREKDKNPNGYRPGTMIGKKETWYDDKKEKAARNKLPGDWSHFSGDMKVGPYNTKKNPPK